METKLYIENNSTSDYTVVTSSKKMNLSIRAISYVALEDYFELYNTNDSCYQECLKRKLPTLIIYHSIQYKADGHKMRVITLEQKKPTVRFLKEIALGMSDTRDIECIIADNLMESKLQLIS